MPALVVPDATDEGSASDDHSPHQGPAGDLRDHHAARRLLRRRRYAKLDRYVVDRTYEVTAHFSDSGGAFAGSQVTYRGVSVGKVDRLVLTDDGVDVVLKIENDYDDIPADSRALIGNGSAVGEQYVELQPQSDEAPYLDDDSEIAMEDTQIPIATETLLANLVDHGRARSTRTRSGPPSTSSPRPSPAPARTCSGSSTRATRSSRPPTPTST